MNLASDMSVIGTFCSYVSLCWNETMIYLNYNFHESTISVIPLTIFFRDIIEYTRVYKKYTQLM